MADTTKWAALFDAATAAGRAAGMGTIPPPMTVTLRANPMDDGSPPVKSWYVPEGPCGFAWVTVRPGTSSFAKWLVKTGKGSKAYGGGVSIWIGDYNQSIARKEAHARAMAEVFTNAGITAYADSRLD